MPKFAHAVCPGCTCLCDDIGVSLDESAIAIDRACERGSQWFRKAFDAAGKQTSHQIKGQPCSFEAAVQAAAEILKDARSPLICQLDSLTVPAQQLAWKLADVTAATIDNRLGNHGRGSIFSLQKHGKVTASLGEIANRSDLVVFWFCDPETTHPRHLERYSRPARGVKRKVIVVDDQETATARKADEFIRLSTENAAAMLMALRGEIGKAAMDETLIQSTTGLEKSQVVELATQLTAANYGAFLYGHPCEDSQFDLAADQVPQLIRQLNDHTRFVSLAMRADANGLGAENVLASSSGYPFAINYSRKQSRFFGLEYSGQEMLKRNESDAILLAGDSLEAVDVPTIQFSTTPTPSCQSSVVIHISTPGMDDSGDYCRQDNVMLPLVKLRQTQRPSASQAFQAILDRLTQ